MDKKIYLDCKKILKKFIENGYWKSFNSGDIFYFKREGKDDSIFTFVETMIDDSFGGQLFSGKESFNYVHDLLTTNLQSVTMYDCDAILFSMKTKEEVTESDKLFLNENNMRVQLENNFLCYRYEPGKKIRMANDLELNELLNHLSYLNSIIPAEYDSIINAFSKDYCVYSIIDEVKFTYEIVYRPLPYLESKIRLSKANIDFVLEFTNKEFVNSEAYLFLSYVPMVIKNKNIRPLMIYLYYPKENKHLFKYMTEEFKKNKNMLYGILDEAFSEIGKPFKMYINNRHAHAYLKNTLDSLNIENEFLREEKVTNDNIDLLMQAFYNPKLDEIVEEADLVNNLMDVITKTLNQLKEEDFVEEDYDNNEPKDLVS